MTAYTLTRNGKTAVLERDDAPAHPCALYPERGIDTNTIHGEPPVVFAERMTRKGWAMVILDAVIDHDGVVTGWMRTPLLEVGPAVKTRATRVLIGYDPEQVDPTDLDRFACELAAYINRDCWIVRVDADGVNECVYGYGHAVAKLHNYMDR